MNDIANFHFKELNPILKQLNDLAKKHNLEYSLIIGFEDTGPFTAYCGEKRLIKNYRASTLCDIFQVF